MSENRAEVLAGLAVVAVAAGFMLWAGSGSRLAPAGASYPLEAAFRSVEGVSVGTDVRLAGVKIGMVSAIALDPTSYFAKTTLALDPGVQIPDDSVAIVASEGLMGGAYIEIVPGGSPDTLAAGAEITDTQGAVSVLSLMMKFAGGGAAPAAQEGAQ